MTGRTAGGQAFTWERSGRKKPKNADGHSTEACGPGAHGAGGAIGNALEWYDFGLFGYFAPVLSAQFFPSSGPRAALVNTFGVFAAGS